MRSGYIKPVGQETVPANDASGESYDADKDAVLVTQLMEIPCQDYRDVSPVVWHRGLSETCIDQAREQDPLAARHEMQARIEQAYRRVAQGKRVVLVDGHRGNRVSDRFAGMSNADVVKTLRAMGVPLSVLLVTRGRQLGDTDRPSLSPSRFARPISAPMPTVSS